MCRYRIGGRLLAEGPPGYFCRSENTVARKMPVENSGRTIRAHDGPTFRIQARRYADEVKEIQDVDTVAESPTARAH